MKPPEILGALLLATFIAGGIGAGVGGPSTALSLGGITLLAGGLLWGVSLSRR